MKFYYGFQAETYDEKTLVMFDSMKKTGSSRLDSQAWYEHSLNFKPCLKEISKIDPEIIELKKLVRRLGDDSGKVAEKQCGNLEPGFNDSIHYDGFLSVVKKWKKQSDFSSSDLEKNMEVVKSKVSDILSNKVVVDDNIPATLEKLESAVSIYSRDLSYLDLYALENFLNAYPSSGFILTQPHLVAIVGLGLYWEAHQALGDGGFKDIMSKLIDNKKTTLYVFSSRLGLYDPLFSRCFKDTRSKILLFNRNIMTCFTMTSLASFGYYLFMPPKQKPSDVFNAVLSSKSGFNNDTFNHLVENVGKAAYEIGRMVSTVTVNMGIGYLREHSSGIAGFLDYIAKSKK